MYVEQPAASSQQSAASSQPTLSCFGSGLTRPFAHSNSPSLGWPARTCPPKEAHVLLRRLWSIIVYLETEYQQPQYQHQMSDADWLARLMPAGRGGVGFELTAFFEC